MKVLVTGGAGYIGSHTVIELIAAGHSVVVVDNLVNSYEEALERVRDITSADIPFYALDLRDEQGLRNIFEEFSFDAVVHFAGLKAVGESVEKPLEYYANNLDSTLALLGLMQEFDVKKIIFSSSATVYGDAKRFPIEEADPTGIDIANPYGRTKYFIEQIMKDVGSADKSLEVTLLRYFNPVGAHESGQIGEDPAGVPTNLLPYVSQVATGKLEKVRVFGNDYDTPDGTGVRDYVHVVDLAKGHVAALNHSKAGVCAYNLGTGHGVSVLELIEAFGVAAEKDIPYEIVGRRAGDVAVSYASVSKANEELEWTAKKTIAEACKDSWRWQSMNPNGYKS